MAAEHTADAHHALLDQLTRRIIDAHTRGDDDLATTYRGYRDHLAEHTTDIAAAAQQTRQNLEDTRNALLTFAGGAQGIVTERDIHARRIAAQRSDIEALTAARAQASDLDNRLARAESAAAAVFAAGQRDQARSIGHDMRLDVAGLSAEVELLQAAGARSPAAMYRVPEQALAVLDEPSRAAVIAIANSAHTVQPLQLHAGAEKPAALAALAAAAHHRQHRILGLAGTERADTDTEIHRVADTTTSAATARDHLQAGRWQLPIGSLVLVDDADQLPPEQLRWLTDTAAATNTKLVLISTVSDDHPPVAHTLTDALAADLPWAQHLGTPTPGRHRHTTAERAAAYLAAAIDTAGEHTHARQLLHRRQRLITRYRHLTRERTIGGHDHTRNRHRDNGLEL